MTRLVLDGGYIATVDALGTEHRNGHVVIEHGRITAVAGGPAPHATRYGAEVVDATGCLITPGLVNTHHHLYQWITRGYAQDVLGRQDEIGSLKAGKLADIAVWRVDGLEHAGILDPLAALGLGAMPPLTRLYVGGRAIVEDSQLVTAEEPMLAEEVAAASRELAGRL